MKRLLPILAMALLGLSGCDSGTVVSPLAPEVGEPFFAKPGLPGTQFTEGCSLAEGNTLLQLVSLESGSGAPAVGKATFSACGFTSGTLVVRVSDPKTTTVKVWLNGAMVLLPSEFPRTGETGETELSKEISLAELNGLEVRLSANAGSEEPWAEVRVEGVEPAPSDDSDPPTDPALTFELTTASFAAGANMNAACAELNTEEAEFVIADWNQVFAEVGSQQNTSTIPVEGLPWVTKDGRRTDPLSIVVPYYYMISASGVLNPGFIGNGSTNPEGIWLVSATEMGSGLQPVLCVSTS